MRRAATLVLLSLAAACVGCHSPRGFATVWPIEVSVTSRLYEDHARAALSRPAYSSVVPELRVDARDPRPSSHAPRPSADLTVELRQLEHLYETTPAEGTWRVPLLRRLAEGYVEQSRAASRERLVSLRDWARLHAIRRYQELTAEPSCLNRDEVLYYLALERELAGDFAGAQAGYENLLHGAPDSSFVSYARFGLAELLFARADRTPTQRAATIRAYRDVLEQKSPLEDDVHRRLAFLEAPGY